MLKNNNILVTSLIMKFHLINDGWKPYVDLDQWDVLDQHWVLEHY